jgi:hypothetical protein
MYGRPGLVVTRGKLLFSSFEITASCSASIGYQMEAMLGLPFFPLCSRSAVGRIVWMPEKVFFFQVFFLFKVLALQL